MTLRAELALLDLLVERHILRLRASQLLEESDFRGLYVADAHVDALLRSASRLPDDSPGAVLLSERIESARAANERELDEPLASLRRKLSLDRFDIELLVLAAATEVDLRYQTLFAYAQNDVTRKQPSVALALQLLCDSEEERVARRRAFAPHAPLFRERLIQFVDDPQEREAPFPAQRLRVDMRVADFLLGIDSIDPRLAAYARRVQPRAHLGDLHLDASLHERIANLVPQIGNATVFIEGPEGSGRTRVAESIAAQLGHSALIVDTYVDALPLLRRESLLGGDAVIVNCGTAQPAFALFDRPLLLVTTESWRPDAFAISLRVPDVAARTQLWRAAVGCEDIECATVAQRFALTPAQIEGAVAHARASAALRASDARALTLEDLQEGAQSQSSRSLRKLAQRIELRYGWDDLILPPRPMQQLRDVCRAVAWRHVVHGEWGLSRRASGLGVAVLLTGASGVGKTMAASVIARDLGLEMYRIDLSSVVSKYIGETEKNLDRVFNEAQTSNAVLFFDEADALFGKRSEVKDAHDRYANVETAYLLQRMEAYDGVTVLATNLSRNLDEAFARRMFATIELPFPDAAHRQRIWRAMLNAGAPVANDVDADFLAKQFELSGGNIRNVVLAAAFAAAASGSSITMQDLILATARELHKIGRLPSRTEFREHYEAIREASA
jgi:MoxR-like ATPase